MADIDELVQDTATSNSEDTPADIEGSNNEETQNEENTGSNTGDDSSSSDSGDPVYDHKMKILRNSYQKLDSLPLGFGIPAYDDEIPDATIERYFRTDLADTFRETGLKIDDIEEDSKDEMFFENRICYRAIKRFRLSSSIFFKFSTAVDGKTVDKTKIPQMLKEILDEYEEEYKSWRLGNIGKLWNRSATLKSRSDS